MSSLLNKLADHPHATSDPNVNPSKGVDGTPAAIKDDNDPNRDDTQNWIAKGQGGEWKFGNDENAVKAGSMSAPDTSVPVQENLPSQQKMRELEESVRK
jgi:hypothetical protein